MDGLLKRFVSRSLVLVLIISLCISYPNTLKVAGSNVTPPPGSFLISNKKTNIVPGVIESEINYNTVDSANPVHGFLVDINLSDNVGIMAVSKDYNKPGVQTVARMADATEKVTGKNIVAAINADLNWNGTGLSNGPLIIDGTIYSDLPDAFFGITKNGEAVIGDGNKFKTMKNDLQQAIRGMGWLVRDGAIVSSGTSLAPRTAVGVKADGTVFFYVVEGRNYPVSNGSSLKELAEVMRSYGAVNALNLDGGGSTTYLAKLEGEDTLALRNHPSDGVERESISSLLVYANVGDGKFDHANISTDNDVYTPHSEVQASAIGVDNAGGSASIPEGVTWGLSNNSFGSIDSDGTFISNGTEGEIDILLLDSKQKIVGRHTIEIRIPNEIHFLNPEYSLGFDEATDFGLRLTYNQKEVVFKDGDIIWEYDDSLGLVENNVFKSNAELSVNGVIKATIAGTDISKSITVEVGKLPIVIFDFENDLINEKWQANSVNGVKSNISIVDKDSGQPVRFDQKSLRLDFDFTTQTRNPGGAFAGFTDQEGLEELGVTFQIPGAPTGLGMWVYGTEEVQGLWLRTGIGVEGNTNWKAFDLAPEATGIDWLGWKYVEVNLTDFAGPYTILPGEFIRLMLTANSFERQPLRPSGNIYVDNITVTYGTNIDDTDSPNIDYLLINDNPVENGGTINNNNITIQAGFSDVQNKYTSGINYEAISVFVDGISYRDSDYQAINISEDIVYLQNVNLTDGQHKIEVVVTDNAGNETSEILYIDIDTATDNRIYFESAEDVVLGQEYEIVLKADDIDNLSEVFSSVRISRSLEDYTVEFSDAFEGSIEYLSGIQFLNVQANRVNDASTEYVFKIKSKIAPTLNENVVVSYSSNIGSFEYVNDTAQDRLLKGFSNFPLNLGIAAPINISSNIIYVGEGEVGIFTVTDFKGNTLSGATIFEIISGEYVEIGVTDEDGIFITDRFSKEVVEFTLVAEYEDNLSFEFKGQSFLSDGELDGSPFGIHFNATKNPENSKNISWLSNISGNNAAYVEFALESDYTANGDAAFTRIEGTSAIHKFTGAQDPNENAVININNVKLQNLKSGSSYVYRVGNDAVWSKIGRFSTTYKSEDSTFLIIGDVQTQEYEKFRSDLANIGKNGVNYDFAVQMGDLVDDAGVYKHWQEILTSLSGSEIGDLDMIHVLGNHEYYGDVNADHSAAIYHFPSGNKDYYSVEYQNVYFGVVNYTMNRSRLTTALEWIVEDANQSNATWKVLLTHQPPYYLNPQGGNEMFNEVLPQYAQAANIDFVFSGHDHSYARTEPLIDGKPNDEGVVYIVTGALGEKRYSSFNNPDFNFRVVNDTFDSIYLTVKTTEQKFELEVREVETGEIIDVYEKTVGSDDVKDLYYVIDGDRLIREDKKHNRPLAGYVGFAKTGYDADDPIVYLMDREFFKGVLVIESEIYYFDEETGYAVRGESEVLGLNATFDNTGKLIEGGTGFIGVGSRVQYFEKLILAKGWTEINGDTYYFDNVYGYMARNIRQIGYSFYEFTDSGIFISQVYPGFNISENGTYYLTENGEKLKGWQEIDGDTYYFSQSATGYMRTGKSLVDGKFYEFGDDGIFIGEIPGGFVHTEEGTYYLNHDNQKVKGWYVIDEDTYYFSQTSTAYMRVGETIIDGTKYTFGPDGKLVGSVNFGFNETEDGTYYLDSSGNKLRGWQEIDGSWYYFSLAASGYMRTGKTVIDGESYEFDRDGKLIDTTIGFQTDSDGVYYLDADGKRVQGWHKIDDAWYYFSRSATAYMRVGETVIDGSKYKFSSDGKLVGTLIFGFNETKDGTYYLDAEGYKLRGWQEIDGSLYYFSLAASGYMRTGRTVIDGESYEFDRDGKLIDTTAGFKTDSGGVYYLDTDGTRLHGWHKIDGAWYYFSRLPEAYIRTSETVIDGSKYTFGPDGKLDGTLTLGFNETEAGTYYLDKEGYKLRGWQEIDGFKYYFSTDMNGYMRTGSTVIGGESYEFGLDGKLIDMTSGFKTEGDNVYYLDGDGTRLQGWHKIGDAWYYFSRSATAYMRVGETVIDGSKYTFASDGKLNGTLTFGFNKTEDGTYYLDSEGYKVRGWQEIDGSKYYFSQAASGYMRTGSTVIDGEPYEFDSDGKLIDMTAGFKTDSGGVYYLDTNGKRLYGWHKIDDAWYYFSRMPEAYMRVGETIIDGSKYTFASDGKLNGTLTLGFNETEAGTYYLDSEGYKLRGWQEIDGSLYYFSTDMSGYMRTGKTVIDGEPYEFDADGKLTDTSIGFQTEGGDVYYLDTDGKRVQGWYEIDDAWYYFSRLPEAHMRIGETVIDGSKYTFGPDGKLDGILTLGFNETEAGTYYLDAEGYKVRGWKEIDASWYYFSTDMSGYMRTGKTVIDGESYEFDLDGKLIDQYSEAG